MQTLVQDIRYGFRTLFKNPGSTFVAIIALTLGIGANSAIFSVVNAILLRPLKYPDAQHLVVVWGTKLSKGITKLLASPPDFRDFTEQNQVFDRIGAFRAQSSVLTGSSLPERLQTASVSPALFEMLGMNPARGRRFAANEDEPGKNRVVILSDGLWRRRFGADPNILGTTLTLDGASYTVIGVASRDFRLLDNPSELWMPYTPDPKELASSKRGYRSLTVIAHLKPGVSVQQAQSQMAAIAHRIEEQNPDTNVGCGVAVMPLGEQLIGDIRPTLWTLLGAVAFVLLIACANVANLLLSRAGAREKEMAVRTSLGANPSRLVRQLLTESVLLALMGGVCGLALAFWGISVLVKLAPPSLLRAQDISIDWHVLAFTLLVSLATGIIFGLAPALSSVRADLNSVLKTSGRGNTGDRRRGSMRDVLVVCEIASCVVLLIGAGLLIRSFIRLQNVNPGFRTDHVLTMQLSLPETRYSGLKVALFYKQLLEHLRTMPGVRSSGICRYLPLSGTDASANFQIEGQPPMPTADQPRAKFRAASSDYFSAMGIPLMRGRYFDHSDDERTPKVVIINEVAARRYFPDQDPIGKRILSGLDENNWSTIVGVVGNVKHSGLDAETNPETYYQYLQVPPEVMNFVEGTMAVVVRTSGDPVALTSSIRNEVRMLDSDQPVFNVKTMEDVVQGSVAQPRFRTWLLGVFAALALLLAAVGLYGVISYSVEQRTNEIGVRAALGAEPGDILKLVVGHGARLAMVGIGIGIVTALALTHLLAKLLFGVTAMDPLTFAGTSFMILTVALLASYIPALRATKVDPVNALRAE